MTAIHASASAGLRVQVCTSENVTDIEVALTANDVTVAEVFQALGLPEETMIDGLVLGDPGTTPALNAVAHGAELRAPCGAGSDSAAATLAGSGSESGVAVATVAGLDAGASVDLGAGLYRLNEREQQPDSGCYVRVDNRPTPNSPTQPWHESAPSIEAIGGDGVVLALGRSVNVEPGHSRAVHRPPRAMPADDVAPIELGAAPPAVQPPAALSWATLLAPIPIAVMMAFFFRPIFAIFAAMGPVMALGRWYESRRRFRRASAERAETIVAMQQALAVDIAVQAEELAQLRWLRHPHVAELWRRARSNSVRLWERRHGSPDFMAVPVGVGPEYVPARTTGTLQPEIHGEISRSIELRPVPHAIDLEVNTGIGIYGDRDQTLAMSRAAVLQLATLHGPADLAIGVVCHADRHQAWDWLKWLPHLDRSLCAHAAHAVVKELAGIVPTGQSARTKRVGDSENDDVVRLIVIDDPTADVAAICRAAKSAGCAVRVLAIAADPTHVPAVCSSLISVLGASAEIASPELTGKRTPVCPIGISESTAAAWARSLTGSLDPEVDDMAMRVHDGVGLLRLVNFTSADDLARQWDARAPDAAPLATLGLSDEGVFRVDLTADGPHALIAGTTGSGKSELLRTLVVSLAVECPPEQLSFVLIDFKGGGAFDVLHGLPHVAGLITDLDATLVERAVHSLRIELQRRESLFRDLGASEFSDAAKRSSEPIARLVIVIDEFAALATDYAELMAAVIDLAARGRSLGMHLILATQRPSGVVDQKIRANTNLRIALRVQDAFDSQDVIGVADAAAIDRKSPGRAILRVGGDAAVALQTAYSGAADTRAARCIVRPLRLFDSRSAPNGEILGADAATEIDLLVAAIIAANTNRGRTARRLWSDPLPTTLDWIDLGARELAVDREDLHADPGFVLGLADEPDQQIQAPWRWDPASGALAIYAASATCAGKALVSLGAALASGECATTMHLYVIDGDAGACAPLASLGHVGAYVTLGEPDRIERTVRMFESQLMQRRSARSTDAEPRMVMIIDNLAAVLGLHDDVAAAALVDRLAALARDGAPQGLHLVITARTVRDIGHRLAQQIPNRLVLALSDPGGYLTLGLKASEVVALPAMRAIDVAAHRVVQLVEPPDFSGWPDDAVQSPSAAPIGTFPMIVECSELRPPSLSPDGTAVIPVGIDADDLAPAELRLRAGDHALIVAGPAMGATSTAAMIVEQLARLGSDLDLLRVGTEGSALVTRDLPGRVVRTAAELDELIDDVRQRVIVVDDADLLPADVGASFAALIERRDTHCRIIATSTLEAARTMRMWTTAIRAAGTGIVLGGTLAEGDLFKARFGRLDGLGQLPGRGHLINRGRVTQVQIARPHVPT